MSDNDDFTLLDDSELERLPPTSPGHAALSALYDESTEEVNDRARKAWSTAN